jgi:glycosyltransferase involved in cell wall biosynthesis
LRRLSTGGRIREWLAHHRESYDALLLQHVSSGFGLPVTSEAVCGRVVIVPMFSGSCYLRCGETVPRAYLDAEKRALQMAGAVLCASDVEAADIANTYAVPREHILVMPFGIDLSAYRFMRRAIDHSCVELLYVATVKRQKNQIEAIRVLGQLRALAIRARLHLVGSIADENYWQSVRAKIAELQLQNDVHYHGVLEPKALVLLSRRCTIAISVALWETFGIAMFEALAMGLPVVTYTDIACVWEYARRDGALIGVPREGKAMSERIAELVAQPGDYARRNLGSRLDVQSLDERKIMGDLLSYLTRLA